MANCECPCTCTAWTPDERLEDPDGPICNACQARVHAVTAES